MTRLKGAIIPPELAVEAMRDSGYQDTEYALAELIDNSVQAEASRVEVVCIEEYQKIHKNYGYRIQSIGVLDNGHGMPPEVLHLALQFGNGTHLKDRKGIGRFGMGLPNSSISQCRRVEVWTWHSGPDNAMYTYLDVDEITAGKMSEVPEPAPKPLPDEWRELSEGIETNGTLVLWTKFDYHRMTWKLGKYTLENTGLLIGRMYRKFIDAGDLSIRLLALRKGKDQPTLERIFDKPVRVNDPLYLMRDSSTPDPFDREPMFQSWGDQEFEVHLGGSAHQIVVRFSWARPETVTAAGNRDRGNLPYGKHAGNNLGLSIVREGRELLLDNNWATGYDPRDRWWGAEVEFPAGLDEIFGVTNNKQNATVFAKMAGYNWKTEANDGETMGEFCERIQENGDPRAFLVPIVHYIHEQIGEMRRRIKDQTKGSRGAGRHEEANVADLATSKFRERAEQGHTIVADGTEFTESAREEYKDYLVEDAHYPKDTAAQIASAAFGRNRKVDFVSRELTESTAFFTVESKVDGLTIIAFNTDHPFHNKLIEPLDPKIENEPDETTGNESDEQLLDRIEKLRDRIVAASDTLHLLFAAWARHELEEPNKQQRDIIKEMRQDWGKQVKFFLRGR